MRSRVVRDSKTHGGGPALRFPITAWTSFITDVRNDGAI
ncbi:MULTISPECIES: DUF397 domain-containing protein [unclassified Streptomyces]